MDQKTEPQAATPLAADKLHPLFKLPSPQRKKAEDGSGQMVEVDFRIGREAKVYTVEELLDKTGLYDEYEKDLRTIKSPRNMVRRDRLRRQVYNSYVSRLKRWTRQLGEWYSERMASQGAFVMALWLPLGKDGEDIFFIQAVISSERNTILLGEIDEATYGLWKTMKSTESNHMRYMDARKIAKTIFDHQPGIGKDDRHRLELLSRGEIAKNLQALGYSEK